MDKIIEKYINDLNNNLLDLPHDERQDVIEFYQEFLFDGNFSSEKEIIKDLGTPKQLARMILADYSVSKDVPQPDMHEKTSSRTNLKTIWLILLGVLAAPVGIPLILVTCFLMIAALVAFCGIFVAVVVTTVGLFVLGVFILLKTCGLLFSNSWSTGLFYTGISICLISLSLFLFPLIIKFIHFLIAECTVFFRYLGRKIFKNHYYKTNSAMKTEG